MATLIWNQVRTAGLFRDTINRSTPDIFAQEHILPKYYALAFFCLLVAEKSWAITPEPPKHIHNAAAFVADLDWIENSISETFPALS
jgi:hypothetical protein